MNEFLLSDGFFLLSILKLRLEEASGVAHILLHQSFGCTLVEDLSTATSTFRSHLNEVVCRFEDRKSVV